MNHDAMFYIKFKKVILDYLLKYKQCTNIFLKIKLNSNNLITTAECICESKRYKKIATFL